MDILKGIKAAKEKLYFLEEETAKKISEILREFVDNNINVELDSSINAIVIDYESNTLDLSLINKLISKINEKSLLGKNISECTIEFYSSTPSKSEKDFSINGFRLYLHSGDLDI